MPRIARIVAPGWPHHVVQRGVRQMDVFFSDEDRRLYLRLLKEESDKAGVQFLAWCLMRNHVHFLAIPKEPDSLARCFKETHRRYTRFINQRLGCTGHLWQERFQSYVIGQDSYLKAALRYIDMNPVMAGVVLRPDDWPWSSARFHLGIRNWDDLVKDPRPLGMDIDWPRLFTHWPSDEQKAIEVSLGSGRPRAVKEKINELETLTGRALTPKRQRHPTKPGQFT